MDWVSNSRQSTGGSAPRTAPARPGSPKGGRKAGLGRGRPGGEGAGLPWMGCLPSPPEDLQLDLQYEATWRRLCELSLISPVKSIVIAPPSSCLKIL